MATNFVVTVDAHDGAELRAAEAETDIGRMSFLGDMRHHGCACQPSEKRRRKRELARRLRVKQDNTS